MVKRSNRSSKSRSWFSKQNQDPYIIKSRKEGYRSRAAYKLLEINEKDRILRSGMIVVDLGSTPGGWSQVAADLVGKNGKVLAVDLLPMAFINNVTFIQGDFTEDTIQQQLLELLGGKKADVVISDMSPNLTGIATVDQAKSMHLVELAYDFARLVLKKNGIFLSKAFHGANFENLTKNIKQDFSKLLIRKPMSSRTESKEVYLLASDYTSKYEQK
ncbi:MAG: RlmE family RNA methyltransferase [Gammaproteobacteria bacterium]|nr:RlmE family RNA methyltransferase [Gammaproteobacteria bacterium]